MSRRPKPSKFKISPVPQPPNIQSSPFDFSALHIPNPDSSPFYDALERALGAEFASLSEAAWNNFLTFGLPPNAIQRFGQLINTESLIEFCRMGTTMVQAKQTVLLPAEFKLIINTLNDRFKTANVWRMNLLINHYRVKNAADQKVIYLARTQQEAESEATNFQSFGIFCDVVCPSGDGHKGPTQARDLTMSSLLKQ